MVQGLYDITPLEPLIRQGYTLLTPNHRLARRIKSQWDASRMGAGERTWEPIAVYPVETWLQMQWDLAVGMDLIAPLTPLRPTQTLELWRQVISDQERQSSDFHLLRPSTAAEVASQARDLLVRWQVDVSVSQINQLFELDGDCRTFLQWLQRFEERLASAEHCTPLDCLAQLPSLAGQLPPQKVALVEVGLLTPLSRAALAALCTRVEEVPPNMATADRRVHAFSDKRAELQALAAWAVTLHRATPGTTIGVVLSDMQGDRAPLEYLLRREFDCLGHQYASLPVNFSTGIPLAQTPLVRDALEALAMGLLQTTIPSVERLVRSRFLHLPDSESAITQRFLRGLYAQGRVVVPVAALRSSAETIQLGDITGLALGECLSAINGMRDLHRRAPPSQWPQRFSEILSIWGWPGNQTLDSLEYQQLALWQHTLDEFGAFDHVCGSISFSEALSLLRDCCHRQISQPQTQDSSIQVLGPLEAAGLSFEHLWLCGMQGSEWPAAPRPNPFIPIALQTRLSMSHACPERESEFAEALLAQYARSSSVLHASYCQQVNGIPDMPSTLLIDFQEEAVAELPLVSVLWLNQFTQRSLEVLADSKAPRYDTAKQATVKGGSRVLEDQSQCPFRAFARHRLEIEPLGALHIALSPGERGSLLHEALFALWGELGDYMALQGITDVEEAQILAAATQAAIATVSPSQQRRLGKTYWRLEQQRLIALLREWLVVERQRSDFSVVAREQDVSLELAGLEFRMRTDRIDQLPDGSHVLIDYKSGNCAVQDWLGDRPAQPQLPLYSIANPEAVSSLAFARVKPRDCRFIGLGRMQTAPGISTDFASDWLQLLDHWRSTLTRLAEAFVAGDAQVDPLAPASCSACGLQALCRVNDKVDGQVDGLISGHNDERPASKPEFMT